MKFGWKLRSYWIEKREEKNQTIINFLFSKSISFHPKTILLLCATDFLFGKFLIDVGPQKTQQFFHASCTSFSPAFFCLTLLSWEWNRCSFYSNILAPVDDNQCRKCSEFFLESAVPFLRVKNVFTDEKIQNVVDKTFFCFCFKVIEGWIEYDRNLAVLCMIRRIHVFQPVSGCFRSYESLSWRNLLILSVFDRKNFVVMMNTEIFERGMRRENEVSFENLERKLDEKIFFFF